jgi:hypothetical protein
MVRSAIRSPFVEVVFTLMVRGGTLPLLLRRLPVAGPLSKPSGT